MKGDTDQIFMLVAAIVITVVCLIMVGSAISNSGKISSLNSPPGVYPRIVSAGAVSFVPPTVIWFGNSLSPNGRTVDFSKLVSNPKNDQFIEIGAKSITAKSGTDPSGGLVANNPKDYAVISDQIVSALMYPLISEGVSGSANPGEIALKSSIDGKGIFYLDPKKEFGKLKLEINVDTDYLKEYYLKNQELEFKSDEELYKNNPEKYLDDNVLPKISFKVCWNSGDEEKCINKPSSGTGEEPLTEFTLLDLKNTPLENAKCASSGVSGAYLCQFEIASIGKCCPTHLLVKPTISVKLMKNGNGPEVKRTYPIQDLSPTIAYYADTLSDRDLMFKKFPDIVKMFDPAESDFSSNPMGNISIYPCRAIAPNERSLKELNVKNSSGEKENFAPCLLDSATAKKDSSGYIILDSGWRCKKTAEGKFFLFNPYAFCPLSDYSLPEVPYPSYLELRMPHQDILDKFAYVYEYTKERQLAWRISKEAIDQYYGDFTGSPEASNPEPSEDNSNANPPVIQKPDKKTEDTQTPQEPVNPPVIVPPKQWIVKECYNCKKDGACLTYKALGEKNPFSGGDEVCSFPEIKKINSATGKVNINSICNSEPEECSIDMMEFGKTEKVKCSCNPTKDSN